MQLSISENIRRSFKAIVAQRAELNSDCDSALMETTLIRNGAYCGRRFVLSGFQLIWFVDERQIKVYSPSGSLEYAMSVDQFCGMGNLESSMPIRRAA